MSTEIRGVILQAAAPRKEVIIDITFSSVPQMYSVIVPLLKYNKLGVFNIDFDDGLLKSLLVKDLFKTYTFTDGIGNNIPYRGAVALNGYNTAYNMQEWGAGNYGRIRYENMPTLADEGWTFSNHSLLHANLASISAAKTDLQQLNDLIFTKTQALGRGIVMNTIVVPQDHPYYVAAGDALGFIAATTQGAKDGYTIFPSPGFVGPISNITSSDKILLANRDFTTSPNDFNASDTPRLMAQYNSFMSAINAGTHSMFRIGTHDYNEPYFTQFLNHVRDTSLDKVWVTSLQEWQEYRIVKSHFEASRIEYLSGNTLRIGYDLSSLADHIRFRDLTLNITSDAGIESINVIGADDFTYDAESKVVNIYKEKTSFTSAVLKVQPPEEPEEPEPGDVTPPSKPTGLAAVPGINNIQFSWAESTDDRGVLNYDAEINGVVQLISGATSLNKTGLNASTSYTLRVRARDAAGNVSEWSSPFTAVTLADPAAGTWTAMTNTEGYYQSSTTQKDKDGNDVIIVNQHGYIISIPNDWNPETGERLPLMIFVHGADERPLGPVVDIPKLKTAGYPHYRLYQTGSSKLMIRAVIVSLQMEAYGNGLQPEVILEFLKAILYGTIRPGQQPVQYTSHLNPTSLVFKNGLKRYNIDFDRIMLAGLSMGTSIIYYADKYSDTLFPNTIATWAIQSPRTSPGAGFNASGMKNVHLKNNSGNDGDNNNANVIEQAVEAVNPGAVYRILGSGTSHGSWAAEYNKSITDVTSLWYRLLNVRRTDFGYTTANT